MPKKIFIGSLSIQTSTEDLQELFKDVGGFVSAHTSTSADGSRVGYAEMASENDAAAAIRRLNGKVLNGQKIVVREDEERNERQ